MHFDPDRMYRGSFLPHCEGRGRPQMITIRLGDSLPRAVYKQLKTQAASEAERHSLVHRYLDQGRGSCLLRRRDVAKIVQDTLAFYDGNYYSLGDWVIMPNHIHFVYREPRQPIGKILQDLKSYTAVTINRLLDRGGEPFWQRDYFDRNARNDRQLSNMGFYTLLNPVQAGLVSDPFDWEFSSIHGYPPKFKEDLRRWYRQWRHQFWNSIL